jgi:ribonuclease HI
VVIFKSKKTAIQQHNVDLTVKIYADGSGKHGQVTGAAVGPSWRKRRHIGTPKQTTVTNRELEAIALAVEANANVVSVYSDSQTALKTLRSKWSVFDRATQPKHWLTGAPKLGSDGYQGTRASQVTRKQIAKQNPSRSTSHTQAVRVADKVD